MALKILTASHKSMYHTPSCLPIPPPPKWHHKQNLVRLPSSKDFPWGVIVINIIIDSPTHFLILAINSRPSNQIFYPWCLYPRATYSHWTTTQPKCYITYRKIWLGICRPHFSKGCIPDFRCVSRLTLWIYKLSVLVCLLATFQTSSIIV